MLNINQKIQEIIQALLVGTILIFICLYVIDIYILKNVPAFEQNTLVLENINTRLEFLKQKQKNCFHKLGLIQTAKKLTGKEWYETPNEEDILKYLPEVSNVRDLCPLGGNIDIGMMILTPRCSIHGIFHYPPESSSFKNQTPTYSIFVGQSKYYLKWIPSSEF